MENSSPISLVVSTPIDFKVKKQILYHQFTNQNRVGFQMSNRMNVAITRAREWRVIVGNYDYFARDKHARPHASQFGFVPLKNKTKIKEEIKWKN